MKTPPYLVKGDKISIVSTARKISKEEILPAQIKLEEWGLDVVLGDNLFKEQDQFAGTDKERIEDFQSMIDDDSVKAIICARGGYGTIRIIDKIDFSNFVKKPKWIIGYSDVTVLHSHIHTNYKTETIHSTMPINFPKDNSSNKSLETLKKALFGEKLFYELKHTNFSINGKAEGQIVGRNLSILYSLIGSKSDINTDRKILFIEDLDEYLYHVDRMMMNLKRTGKLKNLAGLIVGGMSEMNDNEIPFGKTAKEIILDAIEEYNYPVIFDFPAGHFDDNRALFLGRKVIMDINESMSLEF